MASFSDNGSAGNGRQIRLYVGLGRRDGLGRPEIAEFFSDLLHIPGRLVDRIDLAENFSLVSLPTDAAMRALALCKKNRGLPHMHIDVKSDDGFASSKGSGGKRGGRRTGSGRSLGKTDKKEKFSDSFSRKRSGKMDMLPLQHRTSDASLYKKR